MDEVPLTFYLPMNRTVEKTGSSTISLKTGHEKASFTCVLACTASGIHLPPMLIFKRKTMPKEKFPRGVIIKVNEKGWMSNSMLKSWVTECFAKRPDVFFHLQRAMLVMNSMRAHITDDVKDLLHSVNTTPAVIPGGMTKLLQPLDISVNRTFKIGMRAKWENWMSCGEKFFTATGRLRRATLAEVADGESWKGVKKSCILNGFKKAEIYPYDNNTVDSDVESSDNDEPLSNIDTRITPDLAELFHSAF
jgi:hypothetical protein